ncbi:hypothetical protein B0H21DRAFT_85305 [Amylocystis lapponica]|nr:hypothetical protein B0H21DRAFT_85305 [Amylocystis lapponica]
MSTTTAGESQNSRTTPGSTSVPSHLIWEEPQPTLQSAPVRQQNEEEKKKKVELRKLYTDLTWLQENLLEQITAAQWAWEVADGVHGQSGGPIVGMISVPSFCTRHSHTSSLRRMYCAIFYWYRLHHPDPALLFLNCPISYRIEMGYKPNPRSPLSPPSPTLQRSVPAFPTSLSTLNQTLESCRHSSYSLLLPSPPPLDTRHNSRTLADKSTVVLTRPRPLSSVARALLDTLAIQ